MTPNSNAASLARGCNRVQPLANRSDAASVSANNPELWHGIDLMFDLPGMSNGCAILTRAMDDSHVLVAMALLGAFVPELLRFDARAGFIAATRAPR
jgi:hypothetical protein